MDILKDRFLISVLLIGLIIRLILTPIIGFKFDVDTWFAWADRLNNVSFAYFYSDQVWTSYPPGFLYILALLGLIKNLFQINNPQFFLILKIPSILAELAVGILVYRIIPNNFTRWKRIGLILVVLNPAFIFNSSIFGQFDGLFSLTLLLSAYFLNLNKIVLSSIFWGLSFLLKPQAILLLPVFPFYILQNFSIKNILKITLPATLLIYFSFLPFFASNLFSGSANLVTGLMGYYPYNSIFAYNFWGIFGFWISDKINLLNITYQNWGYILFMIFWITTGYFYYKKKLSILALCALTALSFFFLPTRMHERYLYPSLVFLILLSVLLKSRYLIIGTTLLSILHFLNLYYVYVYYNEFYLNLPKTLYIPILYNFLDTNGKLLSIVSTVLFIFISISIIKSQYANKKS